MLRVIRNVGIFLIGSLVAICAWAVGSMIVIDYRTPDGWYMNGTLEGSLEERLSRLDAMMRPPSKTTDLPSVPTSVEVIQYKIGNGMLGPSDYQTYYHFKIDPSEVWRWHALLEHGGPPSLREYIPAPEGFTAWLSREEFDKTSKYAAHHWFRGELSWLVLFADGDVFVYSETM